MRKVYLDDLPRRGKLIDWKNSIGYIVKFEYDNIIGEFKIIDYDKYNSKLKILFKNEDFTIKTGELSRCKISLILKLTSPKFKYKYNVDNVLETNNSNIRIKKQIKFKSNGYSNRKGYTQKGYMFECIDCKYIGEITESNLKRGDGCPVCSNHKVVKNINDIWTKNQYLGSLLAYKEDSYKYTEFSNKKVDWKCPDCGEIIKNKRIYDINIKGLSCPKCSDGISYPNKFMFNILSQLNIEIYKEKIFTWSQNKQYDFYILKYNIIIEIHGLQHYKNGFNKNMKKVRSLKEEQENDKLKEKLARENGIDKYIVIDARKSNLEWIKNSVLNSELNNLFDLSNIDWDKCHEYACNSLVKKACDLWNNGVINITQISNILCICVDTIRKYLSIGSEMNLTNYNKNENIKINRYNFVENIKKPVICLTTNKIFNFIKEASQYYKMHSSSNITRNCKGLFKSAGKHPETREPLVWMYLDEYTPEEAKRRVNNLNAKIIVPTKFKPVVQLSLNNDHLNNYESLTEASIKTNVNVSKISLCCQNKRNHAGGYKWTYLKDYTNTTKSK